MSAFDGNRVRHRRGTPRWRLSRRWLINGLLLPPAIIYVLVENVFWAGARAMLGAAGRIAAVRAFQLRLRKLPPAAVLPLFLVPEIFSHIGGFWATYLLVHRRWFAAMVAGILIKGIATLLTVWIYQNGKAALLSVKWFAWLHGKAMRGRDWVAERTGPVRRFAGTLVAGSRSGTARRFLRLRAVVAGKLGVPGK